MKQTITEYQISKLMAEYPGSPNRIQHMGAKREWCRWRAVLDQIISHPGYRADDRRVVLLLKLALFASEQLGAANELNYNVRYMSR